VNFFLKKLDGYKVMTEMSKREIKQFLMRSTFTAKLVTVKGDGDSHVVPIWFVLDSQKDRTSERAVGDIVFTTYDSSLKIRNIQRDNKVSICVDDQTPQFSFVTIFGRAKIYHLKQNELFKWATKIARRYMGKNNAEVYGKRNSTEGAILVRIKPTKIIAEKDTAAWEE
jgi:PPOX class probable F420-dependent enzyme